MHAFLKRSRMLAVLPALLLAQATQAQYTITNITNAGSGFSSRSFAEQVVPAAGGIGYRATNGGVFRHGGPAAASLTVSGAGAPYDAYSATPGNPGVDYFEGYNNAGSAVEIAGSTAPVFGTVYFSNGSGNPVTISNAAGIRIGSVLHLNSGILSTPRAATAAGAIKLGAAASWTGNATGDGQYVNGYVSKAGNTDFVFPTGDQTGSDMRSLSVSGLSSVTDTIAVAYWKGDPGTALDPTGGPHSRASISAAGISGSTRIATVSPIGFWDWIPVSGTDAATIAVSLADFSGTGGYASPAAMRLVGWNAAAGYWENLSGSSGAASNAEGAILSGTMSNMSAYSAIAVGSVSGTPLPLQLTTFSAVAHKPCGIGLSWSMANEKGLAAFTPQYSPDGISFSDLERIPATGAAAYSVMLQAPATGIAYYRLKAEEADGSLSFGKSLSVRTECGVEGMRAAPNPAADHVVVTGIPAAATVRMLDALGQVLQTRQAAGGVLRIALDGYPAGMYVIDAGPSAGRVRIIHR